MGPKLKLQYKVMDLQVCRLAACSKNPHKKPVIFL